MSTIEVTNINDISGNASLVTDNGGLKTDKLTGKTTAGSISVVGEGNSTTTNLQQGLAKVWVHYNGTGTIAVYDSLNVSSLNDSGTGQHQYNYTNNMSSTNYTHIGGAGTASGSTTTSVDLRSYGVTASTSQSGNNVFYSAGSGTGVYDALHNAASNHGDLA